MRMLAVACLVVLLMNTRAASQEFKQGGQTRPLSPSVMGTIVTRDEQVELVVLWRDSPGWFLGRSSQESAGGNGRTFNMFAEHGGVQLRLSYDREAHLARVGEVDVPLSGGKNVILVDGVSARGRKPTVNAFAANLSTASSNPVLASILSRSPDVIAFLKCDDADRDPKWQPMSKAFVCTDLNSAK